MPDALSLLVVEAQDPWTIGALALGAVLASVVWWWRLKRGIRLAVHDAVDGTLAEAGVRHQHEVQILEQRIRDRDHYLTRTEGQLQQLESDLAELREAAAGRAEELGRRRESEAELRTRLEETQKHFAEKEALFRETGEALKREFELLANRIFEHQGEQHQARLATVLSPFKHQLDDFRKRVDDVYTTDTRDRAMLLSEVRNLQHASERINQEAENLTRALKGDVKLQGNWGEIVLERVLEASGLREGREYFLQASRWSSGGSMKRPDVLIRLPDGKDVVVDAKLSLVAYEQALAEEDAGARERALRQHVVSVRAHVRRLAEQDYDRLQDVRSLDFVLLFVPIEAAFTLAMEQDDKLFTEAFERRIVIVSPTTLMMTLRIIHNVWRYEKQNRNAQEIAQRAGALYDKLRGFVEDMEALGRQLQGAENTYQAAFARLSTGKGNLIRRAEEFRELGAPVKKPFPRHLADEAGDPAADALEPRLEDEDVRQDNGENLETRVDEPADGPGQSNTPGSWPAS